jgi:Spy/CpxP family protein refolding chaperone
MKSRIAAVTLVLIASLLGATVLAESGERSSHDRGDRRGMSGGDFGAPGHFSVKMADRLGLDETQRQSVQNIQLAAEPEMTALRERKKANREKMKTLDANDPSRSALFNDIAVENGQLVTEAALLFDRIRNEVGAVLTEEQRAKVDQYRGGKKNRGRKSKANVKNVQDD